MSPIVTLFQGAELRYGKTTVAKLTQDIPLAESGFSLLVGLNGEGKTTFLRWLSDLLFSVETPLPPGCCVYLPEILDWPGNLNYLQLRAALAPSIDQADGWALSFCLDSRKPYNLLSKGNRQKIRILLTEALALQQKTKIICLDEPLSGLDYRARETVWNGWKRNLGWSFAHRIVSMHPSDIPYPPDQIILVAHGQVSLLPVKENISWDEIKKHLQS